MVDFFARQEKARLNTLRLLPYFIPAVFLTAVAIYLLCIAVYGISVPIIAGYRHLDIMFAGKDGEIGFLRRLWIPSLFWSVLGLTLVIMISGSVYKFLRLRKGGCVVATDLGGTRVDPQTKNADERRLLNVVEEMSIASSTPMPDVYILHEENCINAFAAGHSVGDMVIGVTHGCLRVLDRDELQGVIAHEYSHILNGDMRLNMRLAGIVHGIFCITLLAYEIMTIGEEREIEDKTPGEIFGDLLRGAITFVLAFIGFNGALFGRAIKSAVCREREFLADAAAVQFTRYPDGLAGALKKAEAWASQRILLPAAEEHSHIFFNNVRDDDQLEWTSTHPPIAERMRRLNPGFNQSIEPPTFSATSAEAPPEKKATATVIPLAEIVAEAIEPTNEHLAYASKLLASLPEAITEATRDPAAACALIYALILGNNPEQLKSLQPGIDAAVYEQFVRLAPIIAALEVQTKLPLVELSFPALRRLSTERTVEFLMTLEALIYGDKQIDIFEFALQKMVLRHFQSRKAPAVKFTRVKPLAPACSILLSTLAHVGHDAPAEIEAAFRQGGIALGIPADDLELLELSDCDLSRLETSLNEIAQASPGIKNLVLNACLQTISADGAIRIKEVELLRAIADSLGYRLPPVASFSAECRASESLELA
jgi:Zn-dependent protease with chaperone function